MKILVITGNFPPDIGGPATYLPLLCARLTERGHKICVLTLWDARFEPDDEKYPFEVIRIPLQKSRFKAMFFKCVSKIVESGRNYDVLYVHGIGLESVMANFILRKPLVHKVAGDWAWESAINLNLVADDFEEFQRKKYPLKIEYLKMKRNFYIRRGHRVIVPSNYLKKWVNSLGVSENRISVVYNTFQFDGDIKDVDIPLKTDFNILTVGRLVKWKHIDEILEVIARFGTVGLIVLGDGTELNYLKKLSEKLGVRERVCFAGRVPKSIVLGYMKSCQAFVLNSNYEGFPHVVIEAMHCGIPLIASRAGGTPEIVKDGYNGFLIERGNLTQLEDRIRAIMEKADLRARFISNGYETVSSLNVDGMVNETEAILQSMIK
ncbi:MAG: glycosyltransferase family 4 protein [bacterium]